MLTVLTDFPSYASQAVCQVSQVSQAASQAASQGLNIRKCVKNIYNSAKACLFPFFKSRTCEKVIWDTSCEVTQLPIFNAKQSFLFPFSQVGNMQGPHTSPQALTSLRRFAAGFLPL